MFQFGAFFCWGKFVKQFVKTNDKAGVLPALSVCCALCAVKSNRLFLLCFFLAESFEESAETAFSAVEHVHESVERALGD